MGEVKAKKQRRRSVNQGDVQKLVTGATKAGLTVHRVDVDLRGLHLAEQHGAVVDP